MEVQFEGNSSEEEVDGLCDGAVKGGSSGCACGTWHVIGVETLFQDDARKNAAIQTLES